VGKRGFRRDNRGVGVSLDKWLKPGNLCAISFQVSPYPRLGSAWPGSLGPAPTFFPKLGTYIFCRLVNFFLEMNYVKIIFLIIYVKIFVRIE
jgi:hypothetical protein